MDKFEELKLKAKEEAEKITSLKIIGDVKAKFIGKNGEITALLRGMKDIPAEMRAAFAESAFTASGGAVVMAPLPIESAAVVPFMMSAPESFPFSALRPAVFPFPLFMPEVPAPFITPSVSPSSAVIPLSVTGEGSARS